MQALPNALALLCAGTLFVVAAWAGPAAAEDNLPTTPDAPTIGMVTAGDHTALVRWAPPASDGGAPIIEYVIRPAGGGEPVSAGPAAKSVRMTRLPNGAPVRFTVEAVNALGAGPRSAPSVAVVPRGPVEIEVLRRPVSRVVYGAATTVQAALVRPDGSAAARQRVELHASVRPSGRWRLVAAGTTGTGGRATLRAMLPASSRLRLHHPPSELVGRTLPTSPVIVAKRITAAVASTRTRVGQTLLIRGRVAPVQRQGTPVYLQRRVSGSWSRVATGRMGTDGRYLIRWTPSTIGYHALRAVVPRYAARVAGVTPGWWQRVTPESTADIAGDILRDPGITLATEHVSGASDRAHARRNIVDVANGRKAYTSCFGSAPCRSTTLDRRMLRAIRHMGQRTTLSVSEFAGGAHAGGSAHYSGRGVDINWVNGQHVGRGSNYGIAVDLCRAYGADQIYTPGNDPWGGHHHHVHCSWS